MTKTADQWLELVKKARHLKPKKYRDWCFIVGSSGSLEERIELGEKALEMLKPKSGEVVTFNFSRGFITSGRMEPEEERSTESKLDKLSDEIKSGKIRYDWEAIQALEDD